MPDITMCTNSDCPIAKECYRQTCTPNEYYQSYMYVTPIIKDDKVECEFYIEPFKKTKQK